MAAISRHIRDLPDRLQTVLGLHYLEGLTYREIAKILDVREPRICQLHADGLKKLRLALANDEGTALAGAASVTVTAPAADRPGPTPATEATTSGGLHAPTRAEPLDRKKR